MTERLESLPGRTSLPGEAAVDFADRRRRITRRFRSWRANFAAIRGLLESDPERAAALAGNYATEAEAVLEAWLDTEIEAAAGRLSEEEAERWRREVDRFLESWDRASRHEAREEGWDEESSRRFEVVLDELLERAEERTMERLQRARARPESAWERWARTALGWWDRLFRPDRFEH